MKVPTDLGKKIRQARQKAGLSQRELGRKIGLSDKTVSAYELNRATPPISKLKKIAEATNVSLNNLIGVEKIKFEDQKDITVLTKEIKDLRRTLKELVEKTKEKVTEVFSIEDFDREKFLKIIQTLGTLKQEKRIGWSLKGIK